MKATNFLLEKLSAIYNAHSYLEIKYEFRSHISTHIVEVRPSHCFEGDKEYITQQILIEDMFENLFPTEEIVFITDNPLLKIKDPLLSLGVSELNVELECILQSDMFAKVDMEDYSILVQDYLPEQNIVYEEYQVPIARVIVSDCEPIYVLTTQPPRLCCSAISNFSDQINIISNNIKKDSENSISESFFY